MENGQNRAKIILLRGNSGSGKTTVAGRLQKELGMGTMVISQDAIRRTMLWVNDGEGTKAQPLLIDLVKYGREHCEFVILEGILKAPWYKELFETVLAQYGSENVYAYYYEIPFEETIKRHQTRAKCQEFGEEDMRRWWNEKDYIGFLPEKTVLPEMGIDATIAMILNDISFHGRQAD